MSHEELREGTLIIVSMTCICGFIYSQQREEERHILTSKKLEPATCLTCFLPQEQLINIRIIGNSCSFDRLSAAALHSLQNSQMDKQRTLIQSPDRQHQPSDTNTLFTISRHTQSRLLLTQQS